MKTPFLWWSKIGPRCEPGDDGERPVFAAAIFDHQADGEHIVVGLRIKGEILMPAERAAAAGRLEVEFGVIEADAAAQQTRDDIDNLLAANRLREDLGRLFRIGDAPQRRAVASNGNNVVMSVVCEFAVADGGDNARDFALQAAQQIGRREIFDHGKAVAPIARFDGVEIGSVFHRIFLRDFAFYYTHAAAFCKGLAR